MHHTIRLTTLNIYRMPLRVQVTDNNRTISLLMFISLFLQLFNSQYKSGKLETGRAVCEDNSEWTVRVARTAVTIPSVQYAALR